MEYRSEKGMSIFFGFVVNFLILFIVSSPPQINLASHFNEYSCVNFSFSLPYLKIVISLIFLYFFFSKFCSGILLFARSPKFLTVLTIFEFPVISPNISE